MKVNVSFLTGQTASKSINDDEITVFDQIKILKFILVDRSL